MNRKQLSDAFVDYMDQNLNALSAMTDRPRPAVLFSQDEFAIYEDTQIVWITGFGEIEIPNVDMDPRAGWLAFVTAEDGDSMKVVFGDQESPYTGPGADEMPQRDGIVFAIPNEMLDKYSMASNEL